MSLRHIPGTSAVRTMSRPARRFDRDNQARGLAPFGTVGGPSLCNLSLDERLSGDLHPARRNLMAAGLEFYGPDFDRKMRDDSWSDDEIEALKRLLP